MNSKKIDKEYIMQIITTMLLALALVTISVMIGNKHQGHNYECRTQSSEPVEVNGNNELRSNNRDTRERGTRERHNNDKVL